MIFFAKHPKQWLHDTRSLFPVGCGEEVKGPVSFNHSDSTCPSLANIMSQTKGRSNIDA